MGKSVSWVFFAASFGVVGVTVLLIKILTSRTHNSIVDFAIAMIFLSGAALICAALLLIGGFIGLRDTLNPEKRGFLSVLGLVLNFGTVAILGYAVSARELALQYCARHGMVITARAVLLAGVDIETPSQSESPLNVAASRSQPEMVRLLLEKGARPDGRPGSYAPLLTAIDRGSEDMVETLVRHGADIHCRGFSGFQPIHRACYNKGVKTVALLLDKGANIDAFDEQKHTPLFWAVANESAEATPIVALLLAKGADVNAVGTDGATPILHAFYASKERPEVVRMLLEAGANPHVADDRGKSLTEYAKDKPELQKVLDEVPADRKVPAAPESPGQD